MKKKIIIIFFQMSDNQITEDDIVKKEQMSQYYFIGEKFIERKLSFFLENSEIYKVGEDTRKIKLVKYKNYETPWWFEYSQNIFGKNVSPNHWVIVLKFDIQKLYNNRISLTDLSEIIEKELGKTKKSDKIVTCVQSPLIIGEIHLFINFTDIFSYVRPKIDSSKPNLLIDPTNVLFYNVRDVFLPEIQEINVQGVPGINKIFVKKDSNGFKIDTQGINFESILAGTYGTPQVIVEKTTCDKIHDIQQVLGIEAVRAYLVSDINRVLSSGGTYINIRHISLLVDILLRKGTITPIGRNGMGAESGPISRGLFEQPIKIFAEAAAETRVDNMNSISANVMMGGVSKIGANTISVIDMNRRPIDTK